VTLVVGRREGGPVGSRLARYGLEPHPNLQIVGVPAIRLPASAPATLRRLYTRFWNWSYLAGCLALLPWLLRSKPMGIVARDYRLAQLLLALRPLHGRRLVFEVHGLPSAELLDGRKATTAIQREADRLRNLEQAVFQGAWRLIPITDCLHSRLVEEYGVSPERVFTVPDASRLSAEVGRVPGLGRAAEASSRGRDGARPRLIYVGQLYPHKGVDLLLHALVEVPRAELVIVGGLDDDPQRARLEQLATNLGVAKQVIFTGPQPYARVPELLAKADIALLPLADGLVARCFTSPLKLFDYLAAGLPIVAMSFPTVREVLRDGHNGLLVAPNDPPALAAAVNCLLDDPELAQRLASQARRDAADFSWERRARRILRALQVETDADSRVEQESAVRLVP
jgi:glycosyltransferase involved in cell wall biosynthesis